MNWWHLGGYAVVGFVGLCLFFGCFVLVRQQSVAVIERFGKFNRLMHAGLNLKIPMIERVEERVSTQIWQFSVDVESITKDKATVTVKTALQINAIPERANDAHYLLKDFKQLQSRVCDVVRAETTGMDLDEVFANREAIRKAIIDHVKEPMNQYGYEISSAQVMDIVPQKEVVDAMNRINAAQRSRVAAEQEGEAHKIKVVKEAEAEAESKRLSGEGIAKQRKAIAEGLRESVASLAEGAKINQETASQTLLLTQYFDTLRDIGKSGGTVIMLPSSPGGMTEIMSQIIAASKAHKA